MELVVEKSAILMDKSERQLSGCIKHISDKILTFILDEITLCRTRSVDIPSLLPTFEKIKTNEEVFDFIMDKNRHWIYYNILILKKYVKTIINDIETDVLWLLNLDPKTGKQTPRDIKAMNLKNAEIRWCQKK